MPVSFFFKSSRSSVALLLSISTLGMIAGLAAWPARATDKPAHKKSAKSAAPLSFTVLAAGDIADCNRKPAIRSGAEQTARLIEQQLALDPAARVLTLGDNTYPVGKPEEFRNCYDPTWGRFKDKTWPTAGNHDYAQPNALAYYQYFGEAAGPERRGYYVRQLGNWQIIALNSNLNAEQMQQQLSWLKEQLEDSRASCRLAFWHHPVFSSGGHGSNQKMLPFWQLLADAGTELVLAGHDHDYERFAPLNRNGERDDVRGIRSLVVGTGGATLTPMFFAKSSTEVRDNSTFGVVRLKLGSNDYEWEFLPVEQNGFRDHGKGSCHSGR